MLTQPGLLSLLAKAQSLQQLRRLVSDWHHKSSSPLNERKLLRCPLLADACNDGNPRVTPNIASAWATSCTPGFVGARISRITYEQSCEPGLHECKSQYGAASTSSAATLRLVPNTVGLCNRLITVLRPSQPERVHSAKVLLQQAVKSLALSQMLVNNAIACVVQDHLTAVLRPGLPERVYEDGELLLRQGEQGTLMMYILEGQVEVTVRLQIPRDGSSIRYQYLL